MIEILKTMWLIIKGFLWPIFEKIFLADYVNTWVIYGILMLLIFGGVAVTKASRKKLWGIASTVAGILGTIFMLSSAN